VGYETSFWSGLRWFLRDPTLPTNPDDPYSNLGFVRENAPLAHAVAAGTNDPECGTTQSLVATGEPWTEPLPDGSERCPLCMAKHPVGRFDPE
jgi:hypothetical protein